MTKTKKSTEASTVERRMSDRRQQDRRQRAETVAAERRKLPRREKVNRRRQIDPTTCEREYTDAEIEFMQALDAYKRTSGRMFPTCSEILEVILGLGYVKMTECSAGMSSTTTDLVGQGIAEQLAE